MGGTVEVSGRAAALGRALLDSTAHGRALAYSMRVRLGTTSRPQRLPAPLS
ncbi:hypothetical protein [Tistlia consotensis]|uniref:hypothetical protein n=1 Tax=Tistlia consotensis TaxID=1321365 RepID=UPI0013563DCE|nr:hypothetical protein [Tistlia consotensis]